jgi:cytochrome b6-f complex iron-sulfur subunit
MAAVVPVVVIVVVGAATLWLFLVPHEPRPPAPSSRERSGARSTSRPGTEIGARARRDRRAATPAGSLSSAVVRREVSDDEVIGVSRRQFLNRGLLAILGAAFAGFGAASLGFLWPSGSGGFGGKVLAGKVSDFVAAIEAKAAPVYVPEARAWIVRYPAADLPAAKKVYSAVTYAGMVQGFVALYQRCPHLGCRVPWCQSSQWFECPCHGSKYNRVGEKKAGPAPRGMDRFGFTIAGGQMTIDTSDIELGPPIGTNTTGQQQQGPLCV